MKRCRAYVTVLACTALAGCASYAGRGLAPGTAAAEVERVMGPPAERVAAAGGENIWFYPRPNGFETYAVRLGGDSRVVAIEQRMTMDNISKVQLGVATAREVRELFGPPFRTTRYPMQQRLVWEYGLFNAMQVEHFLSVQFSPDGVVREVFMTRHPKYDQPGGYR